MEINTHPLIQAVRRSDLGEVRGYTKLLSIVVNIDNQILTKALLISISHHYNQIFNYLRVTFPHDPNAKSLKSGKSLLMTAILNYNTEVISILLDNPEIKINDIDNSGRSALWYAIESNDPIIFDLIVAQNPIVHNQLIFRVYNNQSESPKIRNMIYRLISDGQHEELNSDLLYLTARSGDNNLVDQILSQYKYLMEKAILTAIEKRDRSALQFLLKKGANLNDTYFAGRTPLTYAVIACDYDMVKFLVENGANINYSSDLWLPIMRSVNAYTFFDNHGANYQGTRDGHRKILKYLIEQGAYINSRSPEGYTLIMTLLCRYQNDLISDLIQRGADLTLKNNYDETALDIAIEKCNLEIVTLILATLRVPKTQEEKDIIISRVEKLWSKYSDPNYETSRPSTLKIKDLIFNWIK